MKTTFLKKLLFGLWGSILLFGGGLTYWLISSGNIDILLAQPQPFSAAQAPPALTMTPPAATRPPSPTPTETNTPRPTLFFPTSTLVPLIGLPGPINTTGKLPSNVSPLTGLQVPDEQILNRRPVAVKIVNYPRTVRAYQFGLMRADIVYEYYIEDGISRFVAIYYGQNAEKAGPVRSGRYFDEHIMRMYHAALVFANADKRVEDYLLESDLKPLLFLERNSLCPPLCRDKSISGFNNLFVDTAGVGLLLSSNERQDIRPSFFYHVPTVSGSAQILRIETEYSAYAYHYWEYDGLTKSYYRYSDTIDARDGKEKEYAQHIDQLTKEAVRTKNLVILIVPHLFNNYYDRQDQVFNISLLGEGEAYLFREGVLFKGKWIRDAIDQPIRLVDASGNILPFSTGNTFFTVLNPESTVTQDGSTMKFVFWIPPRSFTPTPSPVP